MPILSASALEDDPEGVALLRDVLGPPKSRQNPISSFDTTKKTSSALTSALSPNVPAGTERGLQIDYDSARPDIDMKVEQSICKSPREIGGNDHPWSRAETASPTEYYPIAARQPGC